MRDFKVVFSCDADATFGSAMHEAALKNIDFFFGQVVSTEELLAEMGEALKSGGPALALAHGTAP